MAAQEIKVVLLGDTAVGKSSLVLRFVTNSFERYSESTIGASFMSKLILVDKRPVKLQIWDTAGQEKYRSLAPMYYRGAAASIVVFDVTQAQSFTTLKNWCQELKTLGPEGVVIVVCGNKVDQEDRREVSREEAEAFARETGALYVETSAKTGMNVTRLFETLARAVPVRDTAAAGSAGGAGGAAADGRADLRQGMQRGANQGGAGAGGSGGGGCC